MRQSRFIPLFCALAGILSLPPQTTEGANSEAVQYAVKAAESWLALVDAGEYAKSWKGSAALFRTAVTTQQWEQALTASRQPLGTLVSREVKTRRYATSLPGAPDGEYVVIEFTTSFTNKKSAVETITPMKDRDGEWRVSGYFIK